MPASIEARAQIRMKRVKLDPEPAALEDGELPDDEDDVGLATAGEDGATKSGDDAKASTASAASTLEANWEKDLLHPPEGRVVRSPLEHTCSRVKGPGLWLEFGVASGRTINAMGRIAARHNSSLRVHGFDVFTGLPQRWREGFEQGAFSRTDGSLPAVGPNIELHVGLFQDTLHPFLQSLGDGGKEPVAVAHLDADLYSATAFVLEALAPRIRPGTLLVFDELINFPGYRGSEWKALHEAVIRYNWTIEFVAQAAILEVDPVMDVVDGQQVAVLITGVGKKNTAGATAR